MLKEKRNPYQECPIHETQQFILRMVEESDAEDLLECYSDPVSARNFNSDNCINNFVYKTLEEMKNCISFWIDAYKEQYFIRFSIVDKANGKAVGTIEFFVKRENFVDIGMVGFLRIDLASDYERTNVISELLNGIEENFYEDFGATSIITKAIPEAKQRVTALTNNAFSEVEPKTIVPFDCYFIKCKEA